MPGHKGSAVYRRFGYGDFLQKMMDCDITEISGADNLFQTEGILKDAQERYARLWISRRSTSIRSSCTTLEGVGISPDYVHHQRSKLRRKMLWRQKTRHGPKLP